jgi:lipopolysaccharide export system permease protein
VSIFSRYMAARFFKPFFYGLGVFALLIFLADSFDKMNKLVKSPAHLGVIITYLWLSVPAWAVRVIPMATLMATLVAITGFIRSGEWLAVQSCGFRTRDFWKPLVWCSLAVTLMSFVAQETVLPACYNRAKRLWQDKIHPEWEWDQHGNIAVATGAGQFLRAELLAVKEGVLHRPILEEVDETGVHRQIDATKALWDAGRGEWRFLAGVERGFGETSVREKPFSELFVGLKTPPRNLVTRTKDPDEMSLRELLEYRSRMHQLGVSPREFNVAAHSKLAYPFTNIVLCMLGIPVALRLRRSAKVVSFFSALALSFLYLWVIELGKGLGAGGRLPPIAAAWAANVFFGTLAAWLIWRYDE